MVGTDKKLHGGLDFTDNGSGKDKDNDDVPDIMSGGHQATAMIEQFKNDITRSKGNVDLSKYYVMEGMQNKDKLDFFTEFIDDDDVLRMNTIEMYVTVAPLIIRKTSDKSMAKINKLLQDVYTGHIHTHKTNMVSKERKREITYRDILSSDSSDSGVVSTGFKKFFGVGGSGNGGNVKK